MVHGGPLSPQPGLGSLPAAWLGVLPPPHSPGSFPSQGCGLATSSFVSCQSDLVTSSQSLRGSFSQPQNICVTSSLQDWKVRGAEAPSVLFVAALVPRLLPHTQASPGQGWRGWREGGRPTDTVSSPQPVPFTGRIEGGLQDGHKVTVLGHVPSKGEKRYWELSLSASPLSEQGAVSSGWSSQHPSSCPHSV